MNELSLGHNGANPHELLHMHANVQSSLSKLVHDAKLERIADDHGNLSGRLIESPI